MEIILILFYYFYYLGKDAIYTIPVKNILAVEKLEESSFNKKNVSYINNYLKLFKRICYLVEIFQEVLFLAFAIDRSYLAFSKFLLLLPTTDLNRIGTWLGLCRNITVMAMWRKGWKASRQQRRTVIRLYLYSERLWGPKPGQWEQREEVEFKSYLGQDLN